MRGWLWAAILLSACLPAHAGPRVDYMLHCMGCHLTTGEGDPPTVPSAAKMALFLQVEGGRQYLVRVPGVT